MKVMSLMSKLGEVFRPQPVARRAEYLKALDFEERIQPIEGVDYEWAWDYAKGAYDRLATIYSKLDEKADGIIKYLGGGAGLFTIGMLTNLDKIPAAYLAWSIPAVIVAVLSVIVANLARKPNDSSLPPSVESAFRYADSFNKTAKASFLGQWHLACEGMRLAVETKALRVTWATWLYVASIALLLVPLVIATCDHASKVVKP